MTRQRYSLVESWNRILRLWQGNPIATDVPETVTGEILSKDGAISDLAELLAGSLPGQTLNLPTSVITALNNAGFTVGGGGGGSDLVIYDNSVFRVTGTAISFEDNLDVVVSGTVAYISKPSIELDYSEITSNVSPSATTEGGADVVVTGNSVDYDGNTPVLIEFFANNMRPDLTTTNRNMTIWVFEDGSSIGQIAYTSQNTTDNQNVPCHGVRRITPASGSHTYSIRASVNNGTGLIGAGAGGSGTTSPSFIRISKANP